MKESKCRLRNRFNKKSETGKSKSPNTIGRLYQHKNNYCCPIKLTAYKKYLEAVFETASLVLSF